jgi:hypothetical protein
LMKVTKIYAQALYELAKWVDNNYKIIFDNSECLMYTYKVNLIMGSSRSVRFSPYSFCS